MIVGNGLIAGILKPLSNDLPSNHILFASGVSNSREISIAAFEREERLLKQYLVADNKLIYFSTISIFNKLKSPYIEHKIRMEELIQESGTNFIIFRLGQLVGKSRNRNTLVNNFYNKVISGQEIVIFKNIVRNFLDVEDLEKLVRFFINQKYYKKSINLVSEINYQPIDLYNALTKITSHKCPLKFIESEEISSKFDRDLANQAINSLNLPCNNSNYLESILQKHYGK